MKYVNKILKVKKINTSKKFDDSIICEVSARYYGKTYDVLCSWWQDRIVKENSGFHIISANHPAIQPDAYTAIKAAAFKLFINSKGE